MRYVLGLLVVLTIVMLFGPAGSEAACRAAGEYRVTGPATGGSLTLKETNSGTSTSTGTVDLAHYPRGRCPVCDFGGRILTGQ